jgi:hypothetical protein
VQPLLLLLLLLLLILGYIAGHINKTAGYGVQLTAPLPTP